MPWEENVQTSAIPPGSTGEPFQTFELLEIKSELSRVIRIMVGP
jgi:hypothetical protein